MAATAFSSNDIIDRVVEGNVFLRQTDKLELDSVYDIHRSVEWIDKHSYKKVALQFPDEMLPDATVVTLELEKRVSAELFILGPSSHGSCCVNEVGAEHAAVDAIIHYGHSCLTPPNSFPVLYVFGKEKIDIFHCSSEFKQNFQNTNSNVIIFYDVVYHHAMDLLEEELHKTYCRLFLSKLVYSEGDAEDILPESLVNKGSEDNQGVTITRNGRQFSLPAYVSLEDCAIFYIGEENLLLTNLILSFNKCSFCSYNPNTKMCQWESPKVNKLLMKRYYLIERAKDAQTVGIVVSTVGISKYLEILDHLRHIIKEAKKKLYTLVIGKPTVTSLANFLDIDIFVLVSCLENSLLDSKELYRPVVTPYEMEIACNQAREWSQDYIIDFREILHDGGSYVPFSSPMESDMSLVSGNIRSTSVEEDDLSNTDDSCSLLSRNNITSVSALVSGNALLNHTWQGLEPKYGQTPVAVITEGRTGIASGYQEEGKNT